MKMLNKVVAPVILFILAAVWPSAADPTGTLCQAAPGRSESCVCQNEKGIIDLTPLAKGDGSAAFTGLVDPNGYVYSYNPCNTFTTLGECFNIFICQSTSDGTQAFHIADAGTEEMYIDDSGTPYVYYTAFDDDTGQYRESRVYLVCDSSLTGSPQVTTKGDSESYLVYQFTIRSCHVCPGGCSGGGGGGGGGGVTVGGTEAGAVGIVLMFLLLGGLVTYFVVGAIIMKFKYQATGTDIIPNKAFWIALPLLIKDGFVFTFGPCFVFIRGKIRGSQGYQPATE